MFILIFLCTLLMSGVFVLPQLSAQENNYAIAADSDPEARELLERMRQKYERYQTLKASFSLTIEIPEQPAEIQEGTISQKGEQYHVELAEQAIYCDGSTIWVHLKHNNEVQINSAEQDEGAESLSPKDLLRIHERSDHVYAMGNAYTENSVPLQEIEFKPLDSDSEYSKLRLILNQKELEPKTIKVFNKDGSRYTLAIETFTPNVALPDTTFVFNPEHYPDIFIEDLRID